MATYLILNQNYVQNGLGTLTYDVPTTIPPNNISVSNVPFVVNCQVTVPQAVATGFGGGSGADQGLGASGGFGGAGSGAQLGVGYGATGLGFGGTNTDGASGNGSGYGAGVGGGTLYGFAKGGSTGAGAVGQGFGTDTSGYNQPPAYTSTPTAGSNVTSSLSILVKQNGTTVYTAPTTETYQSALQFKTDLLCNANDVITVVFSSSNAADEALNAIVANVSIAVGA